MTLTILLTEIEEAINQQICKRIPVKATNKATKTATDLTLSYNHPWTSVYVISILHNGNMADSRAQLPKISIDL